MSRKLALSSAMSIVRQFDAYMKLSLSNERKNFFRGAARLRERQRLFSELCGAQSESFIDAGAAEELLTAESELEVMGYPVSAEEPLYSELARLGGDERDVILMSYWLDMSDQEISDETGIDRRTVNRIKHRVYKKLRKNLEGLCHE